jgi:hypothetical protein
MTLSMPYLELPGIVVAVAIALGFGILIGSACTAALMQRRNKSSNV